MNTSDDLPVGAMYNTAGSTTSGMSGGMVEGMNNTTTSSTTGSYYGTYSDATEYYDTTTMGSGSGGGGGGAAAAPTPLSGNSTRGEFMIFENEVIGAGGFGTVYKAYHTETGATVAAKVLHGADPNVSINEITKEVKMLTKLQHQNVVKIVGFDVANYPPCLFMEWMPSGSVTGLMERFPNRQLPVPVIARYGREMLTGLHYLHKHKVLHRDIKPQNILVSSDGVAKLADFGLCKELTSSAESKQQSGGIAGTAAYMSHEALNGKQGPGADIWAVGCTLLEMATGRPPWFHLEHCRGNNIALVFAIGSAEEPHHHPRVPGYDEGETAEEVAAARQRYPSLTPELAEVIKRCFAFDRHKRPAAKVLLAHPFFDPSRQAPSSPSGTPVEVKRMQSEGEDGQGMATPLGSFQTTNTPQQQRSSASRRQNSSGGGSSFTQGATTTTFTNSSSSSSSSSTTQINISRHPSGRPWSEWEAHATTEWKISLYRMHDFDKKEAATRSVHVKEESDAFLKLVMNFKNVGRGVGVASSSSSVSVSQ